MGRIHVLDDHLINRIAAGEVVERPASVVKELVENSLDAGARFIEVRVLSGGRRSIRVTDDGQGMDRDDALLALERHATSKLGHGVDLHAIGTLGFRGEALPSIAAVSQFTLRTAAEPGQGTEVEARAGRILDVRAIGAPRGTTVEVSRLFLNVPARRKFLRSEATELSHIARFVSRYALAHPGVRFHLEHGGRTLVDAPGAARLEERILQLFGAEFAGRLLAFSLERAGALVCGFAGRPADAGHRRDAQYLFVNGRPVQDRVLLHAIHEAYQNTMPRGHHPAVFLFLEIDPQLVDVNVHPQKTEVRFTRSALIHDLARDALASALGQDPAVPRLSELRPEATEPPPASDPSVAEAARRFLERHEGSTGRAAAEPPAGYRASPLESPGARPAHTEPGLFPRATDGHAVRWSALTQFRESYIVAQEPGGLVLVDQHAAHERVLFEAYLRDAEADRVELQQLLFPVTTELPPDELLLVEHEADELRRLGFRVEPFGSNTIRIDAVPAIAKELDAAKLLRAVLGEAGRLRSARAGVTELRHSLVTTAACHAAIKINHPLTREAMQRLLDDLARLQNPSTCPHGRPVLFRLTLEEIERAFRRR